MPWNRREPDPLDERRRQLAEQQRSLDEQMARLSEEIHGANDSSGNPAARPEPLVWRSDEDHAPARAPEPGAVRKRHLAHQRRRDMILVFLLIAVFLAVIAIMLWIVYHHDNTVAGI